MLLSTNMAEFDRDQFNFDVPQELGGGIIAEEEYCPTPGTESLLCVLLLDEPQFETNAGPLVRRFQNPSEYQYINDVIDERQGSKILKYFHSTESLNNDRYDIAEAIRLTKPIGNLIDAQSSLGVEASSEQNRFLTKINALRTLLDVIDKELVKPYRFHEETESGSSPRIDGSYVIEDQIVDAIDLAERRANSPYAQAPFDGDFDNHTADEQLVEAFYEGRIRLIGFNVLSFVHTMRSAEAIDEIRRSSNSGSVSTHSAGPRQRVFSWFGKQVELDQDWVSVVAGGNASQN